MTDQPTKTSTLFLSQITCIDHAWCDFETRAIQGGSFLASFKVTGNIDPTEHVVVDFSTLKKLIKNIIDHPVTGIDHKLWVLPTAWDGIDVYSDFIETVDRTEFLHTESRVSLRNMTMSADVPLSSIVMCPAMPEYNTFFAEVMVKHLVQDELRKLYPTIEVECSLSETPSYFDQPGLHSARRMFRYTHGLKDSTSWGCQNLLHGHLSYVEFYYKGKNLEKAAAVNTLMADFLARIESTIFVKRENVVGNMTSEELLDQEVLVVQYETEARGKFRTEYLTRYNNICRLNAETTIENLLTNLLDLYSDREELKAAGVVSIAISEGLQKGSMLTL